VGAWRFVASPGWGAFLRERGPGLLSDPPAPDAGEVLRESRVRVVRRIRSDGVVLKVYRVLDPLARLRSLFRPSRARREWTVAHRLRERGVAAAPPLAFGERRRGVVLDRCFYLCGEIPEAIPSDRAFEDLEADRGPTLRRLGAFVARVHDSGVIHGDLHAANVLVGPEKPPAFHLVDLHAARRAARSRIAARAADVAALLRGLDAGLRSEDERDALVFGYLEAARLDEAAPRFREEVRRAEERLERRRLRSRTRRARVDSPEFALDRAPGRSIHRRREVTLERVEAALDAHARARGEDVLGVTPRGRATRVPGDGGEAWFVKEAASGGPARALADLARGSRGRRAWIGARLLELLGLPAPRSLALVEVKRGPFVVRSFLLRRFLAEAKTLRGFLAEDFGALSPSEQRAFATEAAREVGRLALAGLLHRDLSTKNLLVVRRPHGLEFSWIDLEDVHRLRSRKREPWRRALAQLNDAGLSRTARLRFLRAWEATTRCVLSRSEIAGIEARTRERVRRREILARGG